jgi:choice-of-anchor A domain-containing protein
LFVRETISGIPSTAGPIAAGGDITLSSMSINGASKESGGLIAGGRVVLANGSITGDVTYGIASTIPQSVSVSGKKSQNAFAVETTFQNLESLSQLLANEPSNGTSQLSTSTLQLVGKNSTLNVFNVSADTLKQATSVFINVPAGAATLIAVSGTAIEIANMGISLSGATASTILWDLPAARTLSIMSVSLPGSILAPDARVSFTSGNLNGTIIARSFTGIGSGSLQYAPLNVPILLGANSPSAVRLMPKSPLKRGCFYQFQLSSSVPLTSSSDCLNFDLNVRFRVAPHPSDAAARELFRVQPDSGMNALRALESANRSISEDWGSTGSC